MTKHPPFKALVHGEINMSQIQAAQGKILMTQQATRDRMTSSQDTPDNQQSATEEHPIMQGSLSAAQCGLDGGAAGTCLFYQVRHASTVGPSTVN